MANQVSAVDDILAEYQGLEAQLSDPELHNDPVQARKVGKRYSELQPIIKVHAELSQVREDLEAAQEMATRTPSSRRRQSALPRNPCSWKKSLLICWHRATPRQ